MNAGAIMDLYILQVIFEKSLKLYGPLNECNLK